MVLAGIWTYLSIGQSQSLIGDLDGKSLVLSVSLDGLTPKPGGKEWWLFQPTIKSSVRVLTSSTSLW